MEQKIRAVLFCALSFWTTNNSAAAELSPLVNEFFYKIVHRNVIEKMITHAPKENNWALYLDNSDDPYCIPTSGISYSREGRFESLVSRPKKLQIRTKSSFFTLLDEEQCRKFLNIQSSSVRAQVVVLKVPFISLPINELFIVGSIFCFKDSLTPGSLPLQYIAAVCEYDENTQRLLEVTHASTKKYQEKS